MAQVGDTWYMTTNEGAKDMHATATRTDIHRPSLADPADYQFMAAFYQGGSEDMAHSYRHDMKEYDAALEAFPTFQGNHAAKFTCDHCGASFAHGALFLHVPTNELVHIGHICASNTIGLPSKVVKARKTAEKYAAEAKIRREREEEYRKENADVADWLAAYGVEVQDAGRKSHPFLDDMLRGLRKWGSLFPRQTDAVRKFMANEEKFAADRAEREAAEVVPTMPVETGRRVVNGTIVHTKWQDGDYGTTPKMLVVQADGNKVWSTVPDHGFPVDDDGHQTDLANLKGRAVTFTGTVAESKNDPHFGIAKRPSNMSTEEVG